MLSGETAICVHLFTSVAIPPAPLTLTEHHVYTGEETLNSSLMHLKNDSSWAGSLRWVTSLLWLVPPFLACISPLPTLHLRPILLLLLSKTLPLSHLHIATASLHTIIILPSPPRHNPGHLSLSLCPHLSISARLGTAGVPLTTTLHWLLLMRNLPSSHLLDVHQRDTERDGQRESFTDCIY